MLQIPVFNVSKSTENLRISICSGKFQTCYFQSTIEVLKSCSLILDKGAFACQHSAGFVNFDRASDEELIIKQGVKISVCLNTRIMRLKYDAKRENLILFIWRKTPA